MKKQSNNTTTYEPNDSVKFKVVNKPVADKETGTITYTADITVKLRRTDLLSELKFGDDDEIADFMGTVDYADPQQLLPIDGIN